MRSFGQERCHAPVSLKLRPKASIGPRIVNCVLKYLSVRAEPRPAAELADPRLRDDGPRLCMSIGNRIGSHPAQRLPDETRSTTGGC